MERDAAKKNDNQQAVDPSSSSSAMKQEEAEEPHDDENKAGAKRGDEKKADVQKEDEEQDDEHEDDGVDGQTGPDNADTEGSVLEDIDVELEYIDVAADVDEEIDLCTLWLLDLADLLDDEELHAFGIEEDDDLWEEFAHLFQD
ncbi:hypothetical protein NPX13_g5014 [Xylaria arbuscula]|uniref:Uncharacterized protein n=1 Tax=Xylaria arbuscula TaxID=114810 RepID=A0A9W8NF71_9PEZI|nr:hypothetical protein NPX13_g5014 [Xylaria arbuscula]